ncbi:MAG: bifunctional riboflavin kinase/FAD synthetase [Spirochaetia bacterium]|nr:bifunctional riboflavin kinase/FAD synthetase [Spirochaetia bacterium]
MVNFLSLFFMQIIHNLEKFNAPWESSVLTLGVFDGMHLGHSTLMDRLVRESHKQARVLVTYDPHPDIVLGKNKTDSRMELFTYSEKLALLQQYDLDAVIFLPFTMELAAMSAEDYLKNILIDKLKAKKIIIGYDQVFGKNRRGDYKFLEQMSGKFHFHVEQVQAVRLEEEIISSSLVRKYLKSGNLDRANLMLGHDYCLSGLVIRGHERGSSLGFPTANIDIPDTKVLPREGVYIGTAEWSHEKFKTMVNIGKNPTFGENYLSVEAHILDFSEKIYGEMLKITLKERIRDEKKFSGKEELKAQLKQDREKAKSIIL